MEMRSPIRVLLSLIALLTFSATAGAQFDPQPVTGFGWTPSDAPIGPETPGGTFNVYTGVATSAGNLFLLEDSVAPIRDDVVPFDGISDPINDYVLAAGGVLRSVIETDVNNGNGTRTLTVTVAGLNPAGGAGDLWPSGFTGGTPPANLTSGGFGIGLTLPATLGGADPLNLTPGDSVLSANIAIATSGVFAAPLNLPASFFGGAAFPVAAWNGVLGVSLGNGATGTAIQDQIRVSITYQPIPEPASLFLLGIGGLALIRRRRA
jgi:hypothetical protein